MKQISISSNAFNDGTSLPVRYTCDGEASSPAPSWDTVSAGTQSIALIVDDLDATAGQASQVFLQGICPGYTLSLKSGAAKSQLETAMSGHILAQGEMIGKYGR